MHSKQEAFCCNKKQSDYINVKQNLYEISKKDHRQIKDEENNIWGLFLIGCKASVTLVSWFCFPYVNLQN